jgi:hypothetical protein
VPGGGLSPDHQRWIPPKCAGFFLPVKVLSRVFRGKFVEALRDAYDRYDLDLAGATAPLHDPAQWHASRTLLATPSTTAGSSLGGTPIVTEPVTRATWACPRCGAAMILGPILSALDLATFTLGFDSS